MGSLHRIPLSKLSLAIRKHALAGEPVPVSIRFLPYDDREDLEFCRWSLQGSIQRRNGIRAAKGFTLKLARSGGTFRLHMEPRKARLFARQALSFVEGGQVVVRVGGVVLGSASMAA